MYYLFCSWQVKCMWSYLVPHSFGIEEHLSKEQWVKPYVYNIKVSIVFLMHVAVTCVKQETVISIKFIHHEAENIIDLRSKTWFFRRQRGICLEGTISHLIAFPCSLMKWFRITQFYGGNWTKGVQGCFFSSDPKGALGVWEEKYQYSKHVL